VRDRGIRSRFSYYRNGWETYLKENRSVNQSLAARANAVSLGLGSVAVRYRKITAVPGETSGQPKPKSRSSAQISVENYLNASTLSDRSAAMTRYVGCVSERRFGPLGRKRRRPFGKSKSCCGLGLPHTNLSLTVPAALNVLCSNAPRLRLCTGQSCLCRPSWQAHQMNQGIASLMKTA
jgi:hypothetical protein